MISKGIEGLIDVTVMKGTNRELIRIRVSENSPYIGKNVNEILLPPDTFISCVLRIDGSMIVPRSESVYMDTLLEPLDEIIAITRAEDKDALKDAFIDLEKQ